MKIFISYSHHSNDKAFFDEFKTALTCMQRLHPFITFLSDKLIDVGDRWDEEIKATLANAQFVAFLMSQNFIASNYIWNNELLPTLDRARNNLCVVAPIIVSAIPNIEQFSFIKEFQGLPEGLTPVDQWPNRAEVWAKVAEAIERKARKAGLLTPPAPAPVCAPAPPSSPPPNFKGRAKEIEQLLKALSRPGGGAAAITGLRGMGGVGKTTLAKYVAALPAMQALYPGPPIVVDMQEMSATPLTPAAALLEAARAVKSDTPATDDPNQAAALFYQALSGQRKLVLLDNAPNEAALQNVQLPPGCGLIVTSRTPALLPQGVEVFELDVRSMTDAVALLQGASTRKNVSDEQWEQVAEACGRLPLALRAAAAYLARYKVTSVDDYLRMVRDPARRAKALTSPGGDDCYLSVLGLSVDRLTEDDAALATRWRQLAVFSGDFDRTAAAAVWECNEDAAHSDIEQLYDRALLQVDEATGRYKLHDLLRDVARHGLADNALYPAALCHARHYVKLLRNTNQLYLKGHEDVQNGLSLYDREAHNIAEAMEWAMARGEQDVAAAQVVNELPNAGPDVLRLRLAPETRINWLQAALAVARHLKDRVREGAHLGNLSVTFWDKGDFDAAAECQEARLIIAKELGDRKGEAYTLGSLGNIYRRQEKFYQAIEKFEEALSILRDLKDRRTEAMTINNIANALIGLGEHSKALEYYQQADNLFTETGNYRGKGNARWNMAETYAALGRPAEAIAAAENSLKIFEEIRDPNTEKVRTKLTEWRAAAAKA